MTFTGLGVGSSAAIGPAVWMPPPLPDPSEAPSTLTPAEELERANTALSEVAAELAERASRADVTGADVLLAQSLMARDPVILEGIQEATARGLTAARAVHEAFASIVSLLSSLGGSQGARAADFADVSRRVVARIEGVPVPGVPERDEPFVLIAHDLAPADTALLPEGRVLAFVTVEGSPTSHTAILARSKGVPCVVACDRVVEVAEGELVLVDAAAGVVARVGSDVDMETAEQLLARRAARREAVSGPGRLADGTSVPLYANIGSLEDAVRAREAGAEGVGLLRTEFLYMGASTAPTVEQQVAEYGDILAQFPDQVVTARTLDSGADKPLSFLNLGREENPALGVRGMRAGKTNLQVLDDQLDAIGRVTATSSAHVRVMAPMVADAEEAAWFVERARAHGASAAGVMVEVPACALAADAVMDVVDFVSIGTNDLTQYTMAADRQHGGVAQYQDPWHPSVLRLIAMVGEAGARAGKPVGVCGEAAAEPLLAVVLVGLGVTSLSMTPAALADVRGELARWDLAGARALASAVMTARGAKEARGIATARAPELRVAP